MRKTRKLWRWQKNLSWLTVITRKLLGVFWLSPVGDRSARYRKPEKWRGFVVLGFIINLYEIL